MPKLNPRCIDIIKGLLLIATLVTSGAGLGYWYKDTMQDADHVRELARQQGDYKAALEVLAGRIGRAADQVTEAADTAANAAQTAQDAAGTADKAALNADRAAVKAGKAVNQAVATHPVPAPTKADNRAINQAVQQANTQIKGK